VVTVAPGRKDKEVRLVPLATRALVVVVLAASTVVLGGGRPAAPDRETGPAGLDPAQFTTRIDNPFWPMTPGDRWVYVETDADGDQLRVEVTVTARTKTILGIQARVVRDVVTKDGRVQEANDDWYAQDRQGNLWHLGEAKHLGGGEKLAGGEQLAASDLWQVGAQPRVVVPADPDPGTIYRQPRAATQVLSADTRAKVPYASFDHLVITRESTPLEPTQVEHEFYARGVGPVLAVTVSGDSSREELVSFDPGRTADTALGQ
jgi:hypothetical protein